MQCSLNKVIEIGRRNPKVLMSPGFFEKVCITLGISTSRNGDKMVFKKGTATAEATIINENNCREYKCAVKEGKSGIRIYEFINALVVLLTDEKIPPSPYEKMGQTAAFYCNEGIRILEQAFDNCK